ncbi:hypothetical protein [Microbacterium sp. RURRCA19A]|uniref:hypothetical protein n=1 Tax=Microbacterium sp. RURRCA19A TaxID=1907391 RepID=UPI00095616DF|nr:hypothetical protein [Microbacterium sp. RURRCA19A]SIS08635.1 hypothetical protein SAMN05880568_2641 [Microbacterium sp. RURRCA19A]
MVTRQNPGLSLLTRVLPRELNPEIQGDDVVVDGEGVRARFFPLWVGQGLPADVKRVRNELAHGDVLRGGRVPVVTARRISPGAQEILEAEHLSWADQSGRAVIVVPGAIYIARREPVPVDARRPFRWSAAAEAIGETLLTWQVFRQGNDVGALDRVYEVAQVSGVSLAHSARILRHFDEQGYTTKTGAERGSSAAREFREPGRLLSDWAGELSRFEQPSSIEFHVPWRDVGESLQCVERALGKVPWAVTGEVYSDALAPFLNSVNALEIYVDTPHAVDAGALLSREADLTEVPSRGRIRVYTAPPYVLDLSRQIGPVQGLPVVSPARAYADLLRRGGRHAEAAEHLREAVIGF